MEKDIGKIKKGEFQGAVTDIIIGIREYKGKVGIDIREFVESDKYTGPTKKGLRIPAEHFSKFKEMINSISEEDLKADKIPEEQPASQETLDNPEKSESSEEAPKEDMPDY